MHSITEEVGRVLTWFAQTNVKILCWPTVIWITENTHSYKVYEVWSPRHNGCVNMSYLDSLHLWWLNDWRLSSLDHSMHLHCLTIGQLHQGDCRCWGTSMPSSHCYLSNITHIFKTLSSWLQSQTFFLTVLDLCVSKWIHFSDIHYKQLIRILTCARVAIWACVICWFSVSETAVSAPCWASAPDSIVIELAGEKHDGNLNKGLIWQSIF